MPYVPEAQRKFLDVSFDPTTLGELVYCIYKLCAEWYEKSNKRFSDNAEVISALECAKLEWARDVLGPYEDLMKAVNGGVLNDE